MDRREGLVAAGEWREEGGCGWGGGGAASVPALNDSLGQPLPHMLSGEREAHGQSQQTNRWKGGGGVREVKLIRLERFGHKLALEIWLNPEDFTQRKLLTLKPY